MCLAADRYYHDDHGEWCLAAALRLWHLLPHHDNYHRNIDHAQPLSRTVPISLEHGELDLATHRQFVWAVWLYRSTDGNGSE